MESNFALLSLVFLVVVLVIGFLRKINMGLIAIGAALIIGRIAGVSDSTVIGGFNTSLFMTLLGTSFLFSMAINNGTLDLFAKKILKLTGRYGWLVPIVFTLLTFVISASGPGNIPTVALSGPLAIIIGIQMGIDPVFLALLSVMACNLGCMSQISNGGIIAANLGAETAFAGTFETSLFINCILVAVLFTAILYIRFKAYKIKGGLNGGEFQNLPAFNQKQWLTLAACAVMIAAVFITGVNVGLVACLLGVILVIFGVANEKAAIKIMPWGTFILVCGVSVLMNIVVDLGGIDLMTNALTSMMNEHTAAPILGLTAGIMSWFSSTTGVVMPTLIPTAAGIAETFQGAVGYTELVSAVTITSFMAAFSPASTGGATIIAQYAVFKKMDEEESNRLFMRLFIISVLSVLFSVALAAIGFYGLVK